VLWSSIRLDKRCHLWSVWASLSHITYFSHPIRISCFIFKEFQVDKSEEGRMRLAPAGSLTRLRFYPIHWWNLIVVILNVLFRCNACNLCAYLNNINMILCISDNHEYVISIITDDTCEKNKERIWNKLF